MKVELKLNQIRNPHSKLEDRNGNLLQNFFYHQPFKLVSWLISLPNSMWCSNTDGAEQFNQKGLLSVEDYHQLWWKLDNRKPVKSELPEGL